MEEFKRYFDTKNTKAVVITKFRELYEYDNNSIVKMIYADFIPYYFDLDKTKLETLNVFRKFLESNYKKELKNYSLIDKSIFYYDDDPDCESYKSYIVEPAQ
jgi:hypothetical protein